MSDPNQPQPAPWPQAQPPVQPAPWGQAQPPPAYAPQQYQQPGFPPGYPPQQHYGQPVTYAQYPVVVVSQKEVGIAYLLWFFIGVFGAHQFYLGKIGRGLFYLFTLGGLGIGVLIDLFTLASQTRAVNARRRVGIY